MSASANPSVAPAPARRHSLHRVGVLALVSLLTFAALAFGVSWLHYRYENTVLRNATVKGRLHRIGARIDGQVKVVPVTSGQRVSRGDVLVQLEDRHIVAAVGQARSELVSATRRYEAERLAIEHDRKRLQLEIDRQESIARAEAADVDAMASTVEKWQREYDRVTTLVRAGVASSSEVDRITAERDNSRALKKSAEGRLEAGQSACRTARLALDGLRVREASLEVLASEIESGRQRVGVAEADLAATTITAPEDGWVIDRIVEPGGSAKVGEAILSLWLGQPWIEAWADEEVLRDIRVESPVDVSLRAFPDVKLTGQVESIGVLTDREVEGARVPSTLHAVFPRNAMVPIRVALSPAGVRFQPGLSALVGIRREREQPAGPTGQASVFGHRTPLAAALTAPPSPPSPSHP